MADVCVVPNATSEDKPFLRQSANGLELVSGALTVRADYTHMIPRLKPNRLSGEMLVRAAKIKGAGAQDSPLTAVDATAGLGEDSLLLAAAGFEVQLFERNHIIAALLADGLRRAASVAELAPIVSRMRATEADSMRALRQLEYAPDIILLDPMFPAKRKDSAAKKKLQLFQQLEQPCEDEEALLEAAIAANPRKIVIKRPAKGPYLAGRKPAYSIQGKAIRYDCLAFAR